MKLPMTTMSGRDEERGLFTGEERVAGQGPWMQDARHLSRWKAACPKSFPMPGFSAYSPALS